LEHRLMIRVASMLFWSMSKWNPIHSTSTFLRLKYFEKVSLSYVVLCFAESLWHNILVKFLSFEESIPPSVLEFAELCGWLHVLFWFNDSVHSGSWSASFSSDSWTTYVSIGENSEQTRARVFWHASHLIYWYISEFEPEKRTH